MKASANVSSGTLPKLKNCYRGTNREAAGSDGMSTAKGRRKASRELGTEAKRGQGHGLCDSPQRVSERGLMKEGRQRRLMYSLRGRSERKRGHDVGE